MGRLRGRYILLGLTLLAITVVGFGVTFLLWQPTTKRITVTGVLKQGVEAGCMILETDDGRAYTLVDMPNYRCSSLNATVSQEQTFRCLPPYGKTIVVTGYTEPNAVSYCMQGPLLHVESLTVVD
jgi:hypothetical protein